MWRESMLMDKEQIFQELDGERPNADQAAALMALAEGDTAAFLEGSETDGAPNAVTGAADGEPEGEDDKKQDEQQAGAAGAGTKQDEPGDKTPTDAELNADNAVILAKDGKHTIPFEKLTEARQSAQEWQQKAAELSQQLAAAQQRAQDGQAATKQEAQALADAADAAGVDLSLFGDFSEEGLAKGIAALVEQRANALVDAKLEQALAPLKQGEAAKATEAHYGAIYQAHPDADSIFESKELDDWIKSHPGYLQPAIRDVFANGGAQDVIDVFSRFKEATGKSAQQDGSAKAAAAAVLEKQKAQPPASLSDIPGAKAPTVNHFEQLAQLSGPDLAAALENLPREKVEEFLNRQM
jgi:hypothetical protein